MNGAMLTLGADRFIGSDPLRPRSYHGAGKAAAEHFIHAWATQYEGTAVLLRPSNVYAPGQSARHSFGIIPTAMNCALHGRPLSIWNGSAVRDYLHIDDFVALCQSVLHRLIGAGAHVFNAASSEGVALMHSLIASTRLPDAPSSVTTSRRAWRTIQKIMVDASAARSALGWSPRVSLDEGLRCTWQWLSTLD